MNIEISEYLNQCLTCDYVSYEWLKHPISSDCVCPSCESTDYYIIDEDN
jgi:Zn finger protein HypA/HybF involved in hydrogenase expression